MNNQISLFTDDEIFMALREYPFASIDLFRKYHSERPELYKAFEMYALQMFDSGRKRFGAKGIVERVRWDLSLRYPDQDFKVNNNFPSMYGRLAMYRNPQLAGFFEKRMVFGIHSIKRSEVSDDEKDNRIGSVYRDSR